MAISTQKFTRTTMAAFMVALGHDTATICEALQIKEPVLSHLRSSPLFRSEVERYQSEIRERLLSSFADRLAAEAVPTLERLVSLRDQQEDLSTALGASKVLFDRIVPKKAEQSTSISVTLSAEELAPALSALRELRQAPILPAVPLPPPQLPVPATFEDAIRDR